MQLTPGSGRYLVFDLDLGGFNNILMQLEVLVVLAWLTGRTLVLPPPQPFYLLGESPRSLLDFVDIEALRTHIDVALAEEIWPEAGTYGPFLSLMRQKGWAPGWDAEKCALVYPASALTDRLELVSRLHRRRCVAITEAERSCEILFFQSTVEARMFGVFEAFFLFADPANERRARAVVRDSIRYRPEVYALAARAVTEAPLGGSGFSAMHVRRGDFQYKKTQIGGEEILRHTANLAPPGAVLYVATDEADPAFLQPLAERFRLVRFADLPIAGAVPEHWVGIVETLICAMAPGVFVGTRLSTFSARIVTIRGHLSYGTGPYAGIDTAVYYTQPPLWTSMEGEQMPYPAPERKHADPHGETGLPWWISVQREPIWARAYESTWRDAGPL